MEKKAAVFSLSSGPILADAPVRARFFLCWLSQSTRCRFLLVRRLLETMSSSGPEAGSTVNTRLRSCRQERENVRKRQQTSGNGGGAAATSRRQRVYGSSGCWLRA
eukprot:2162040-Rhodomonas_salina.1